MAVATFNTSTSQLSIESEVGATFNQSPLDFVVPDYAKDYPFEYRAEDEPSLAPYRHTISQTPTELAQADAWVRQVWNRSERIETYTLLERLASRIQFLPGAGWKGFDPTLGQLVGANHIPVAVARLPNLVPPVAGSFTGLPGARLDVGVWVTPLPMA